MTRCNLDIRRDKNSRRLTPPPEMVPLTRESNSSSPLREYQKYEKVFTYRWIKRRDPQQLFNYSDSCTT